LAAGGGAPLRPETRHVMRQSGQVVWLTARPETIHARMSGDATTASRRPSLTNKPAMEEIVHLLAQREPAYRQCAHVTIDTEAKSPEVLVAEILQAVRLQLGGAV